MVKHPAPASESCTNTAVDISVSTSSETGPEGIGGVAGPVREEVGMTQPKAMPVREEKYEGGVVAECAYGLLGKAAWRGSSCRIQG